MLLEGKYKFCNQYHSDYYCFRQRVSKLGSPSENPMVESWQVAEDAYHALCGSMIVAIIQALQAIKFTSEEYQWNVVLIDCLNTWKEGSLIGSNLLDLLIFTIFSILIILICLFNYKSRLFIIFTDLIIIID